MPGVSWEVTEHALNIKTRFEINQARHATLYPGEVSGHG
jgi:hypothetical protein